MNQTAQVRRRGGTASASPTELDVSAKNSEVVAQARALDSTFKSLARKVLIDNDAASELPLRQFRVCNALFESSLSMKELSRELGVSQSAITQIADRLEAAGLVKRGALGDDRRVRSLELTERARKMLRLREERRLQRVTAILQRLDPNDRQLLMASLAVLKEVTESEED